MKTPNPSITAADVPARTLRIALAFAISLFFIWGFAYGLLDVLNKHFQDTLNVGTAESTWLQIAYFGAYLLISLPAGMLLTKKGYKVGILTGLGVTALGAFLFIPAAAANQFIPFVLSMFVLASGLACLETSADSYVNVLGPAGGASRRLNLAQSFNGLGTFIGPLIGGTLFFAEGGQAVTGPEAHNHVQMIYACVGVAIVIFALFVARAHLPEIAEETHDETGINGGSIFKQRHFVFGVLTQAIYIGAQVGIGALFINVALTTWSGLSARNAAYLLSLALVLFMLGRFASTALLTRVSPRALLTVFGVVNVVLALVVAAGINKVSLVAMIATFFFMSTMFPTIFALGVRELGPGAKRGASWMVMAIGGGVILPYPMGLLAETYGAPMAFVLPAAAFALVALYGARGAAISNGSVQYIDG